jgi:hypothetical protein
MASAHLAPPSMMHFCEIPPHTSTVYMTTCTQGSCWQRIQVQLGILCPVSHPKFSKKYRSWLYPLEASPEISICLVSSNYLYVIRRQLSTCNVLNFKGSGRITRLGFYSRYSGYIFIGAYRPRDGRPEHLVRFPPFTDFFFANASIQNFGPTLHPLPSAPAEFRERWSCRYVALTCDFNLVLKGKKDWS